MYGAIKDSASKALQVYKNEIGTVAGYLTIAQFFSGVFICRDIKRKNSTTGTTAFPFIGGIVIGLATYKYGLLLNDSVMLQVNTFAIGLNILYSIFYYMYSRDKWNEVLKPMAIGIALDALLWGYCEWENPDLVETRYGFIVTVLMLLLLGSPLANTKNIIKKKDASEIPFVMTFMGAVVTFSWFLYAIILKNDFMIIQNVTGFILCFMQLILIFLYPEKREGPPTIEDSTAN